MLVLNRIPKGRDNISGRRSHPGRDVKLIVEKL